MEGKSFLCHSLCIMNYALFKKGLEDMGDFDEIKKKMIEENEKNYGAEIKEEYGEEVYEATNNILSGLTEEKWLKSEQLRAKAEKLLAKLAPEGKPESEEALEMAKLHGEWARLFWADGVYSPEAHLALVKMYTEDERFTAYYENIAKGGAAFLRKAVENYCDQLV